AAELLDTAEMPPKDAKQLSPEQKKSLWQWIDDYLKAEARASAGDPGPVGLRRLNNAEYTYTIRDLTGAMLNPAREFPVDGAGGEGFTNAAGALAMSPALFTKYLDAAKEISQHAVLLPDGFRFSNSSTPSDWTNEILADIRELYRKYSDSQGGTRVNLQGIVFDTNDGGRLPIEKYLTVTLMERQALGDGSKSFDAVAQRHGLSPKYLESLWKLLNSQESSPLLDPIRQTWRMANIDQIPAIAAGIHAWQNALTRFQNVGHMKPWMVPTNPLTAQQEIRFKLAVPDTAKTVTIYLSVGTAGDGNDGDFVVWQQPRIVTPGQPDLMLRDVRDFTREMLARRDRQFASTKMALIAAAAVSQLENPPKLAELAKKYDVDETSLAAWFDYLGIGTEASLKLDLFTKKTGGLGGYQFVTGWEKADALSIIANSSDQAVRVPGNMKPHGVCVHPSPNLSSAVGWLSPISETVRVEATVTHAHPECGNGVTWSLELRRGATRQKLAAGLSQGGKPVPVGPVEAVSVQKGDLISLLIGPRDGNHSCDLTDLELNIAAKEQAWSLTKDVSSNIQAANPHADSHGNSGVWHFYSEPVKDAGANAVIPAGSLLARWQAATDAGEKEKLAGEVQQLLTGPPPTDPQQPDALFYRQLSSLGGPLFAGARSRKLSDGSRSKPASKDEPGLDPALFGKHPNGTAIDANSLSVQSPKIVEITLPADLVNGSELVTTARLSEESGKTGSVQVQVSTERLADPETLKPHLPVIAAENGPAWQRFTDAFDEFRQWFP
ncbi:MAG TPA: DUF1587 domain-containing protein, partial [Planctomycetaceae bacterium]|nr:DUF1587 domain-containing protein [Planctomycetaceae bacterium]